MFPAKYQRNQSDGSKKSFQCCCFYAPATKWAGHIVLPLSARTSVTLFCTVLVSATPPKVFVSGT